MISEAVNRPALLCPHDSAPAVGQRRVLEPRDNCHKRKKLVARTVSDSGTPAPSSGPKLPDLIKGLFGCGMSFPNNKA